LIRRPCKECKGEGYKPVEIERTVTIPAGVDNGTRMRVSGEGQPGANGGPAGDLYIVLKVKPHPVFERHENDLHCTIPVNVAQAALGTEVDLLTFDGLQPVKVGEGTQNGAKVRLKNLGVPHLNSNHRGDIYVHVRVTIPEKLTRDQRKLFEQLKELLPKENEPHDKGIFDKVKDYFM
jgi:molecular chaperone DnaJ